MPTVEGNDLSKEQASATTDSEASAQESETGGKTGTETPYVQLPFSYEQVSYLM